MGDNNEAQQSYLLAGLSYLEARKYTQAEQMFASAIIASDGEQSERAKVFRMYALVKNRASRFSEQVLDLKQDVDIKKIKDPLTQILYYYSIRKASSEVMAVREQLETNKVVNLFLDDMKDEIFETKVLKVRSVETKLALHFERLLLDDDKNVTADSARNILKMIEENSKEELADKEVLDEVAAYTYLVVQSSDITSKEETLSDLREFSEEHSSDRSYLKLRLVSDVNADKPIELEDGFQGELFSSLIGEKYLDRGDGIDPIDFAILSARHLSRNPDPRVLG